jgi:arginine N-succinyltransferase
MLYIRPVEPQDLAGLLHLASIAGKGITSLTNDADTLRGKIERSQASFARTQPDPGDYFLLVMIDSEQERVIGTAAAYGHTGTDQAFYAYRLIKLSHHSHSLNKRVESEVLHLSNDYTDCGEVGTLFLDPEYRGNGHWLSRSRYLLIGQHLDRFADHVIAEMRGWIDDDNYCPFWAGLGEHFFEMSFAEADALCGQGSNQFITELMPRYPIYTCLLPEDARHFIGKPHRNTVRAVELLYEEGFQYEQMVDIFDGGPILRARTKEITSVRSAVIRQAVTGSIADGVTSSWIVSNCVLPHFRVIQADLCSNDLEVQLTAAQMQALKIQPGDDVRMIAKPKRRSSPPQLPVINVAGQQPQGT